MPEKVSIEQLNEGAQLLLRYHRAWTMRWYLWGIVGAVAFESTHLKWPDQPEVILLLLCCAVWLVYAGFRVYDISARKRAIISSLSAAVLGFGVWVITTVEPSRYWVTDLLLIVLLCAYPLYFAITQIRNADDSERRALGGLDAVMERSRVSMDAAEADSGHLTLIQAGLLGSRFYCLRKDEDAVAVMVFDDRLPAEDGKLHKIFWVWRPEVALSLNEADKVIGTIGSRKIKGKLLRDDAKLVVRAASSYSQASLGT